MGDIGFTSKELDVVEVPGGNIVKLLKTTDSNFRGFGEAYFSYIDIGVVKAWKKHLSMNLFLTVPQGKIKFVFFDEITNTFADIVLSFEDQRAIIVKPNVWFGFKGLTRCNCVLNIADILHSENEVQRKQKCELNYNW
ncbi:dTDP-4-dehydrorhamnose 3,5-epimerase [Alphaproteobacteria bacterium]|nr:dTDP-4-dehydrorhamnose 3,5-epimerase [Alphaproteobacteria bacterium]